MDSFGNASMQGSSVPMNPMMAMIQRQQQEQQQYEALTAGATMGVSTANTGGMGGGQNTNATTVPPPSSSSTPSMTDNNNNIATYMNNPPFSQDLFQQRQIPTTGPLHQRLPPQQQQLQMNEMSSMYSQARSYSEMNSLPIQQQQQQFTLMSQQQQQQQLQQPMFNVGNLSPSHSPAPNHTQFYSNVDMQASYCSDPSMPDLQTSYMNMVPPAFMSSAMDNYMPLHQSIPPAPPPPSMMLPQQQQFPHMTYSPVPQMLMTNNNTTATSHFGNSDITTHHMPPPPPQPTPSMKFGYPTDGSNLTSMPVQTPSTTTSDTFQPRRDSASRSIASPTTPTQPPPPPDTPTTMVTYIPKMRHVETYGGVDLKYFEKFDIRPLVPHWEDLGVVDMTALTMSLRSGTKMELTNALNTLTTLTLQPRLLVLTHCDGLLDTLLDHLQTCVCYHQGDDDNDNDSPTSPQTYADLFELSLLEMKSLIPALPPTSSQEWLSSRELLLCLLTILRNVSFMEENIDYLARHPRFCPLLINMIHLTQHNPSKLLCMDILEIRKCVLTIYANIAIATPPIDDETNAMATWVYLIHDFVVHGTDTYYATLAMEAWNKCSVHDAHRRRLLMGCGHNDNTKTTGWIQGIWTGLITMLRRQFYMVEMGMLVGMSSGQLGTLELMIMGLYNVVALADLDLCATLVQLEPEVAMTLLRICFTLAEANNHHFRVVAQRGLETVYALILGGGIKVTLLIQQQRTHQHHRHRQQQQQQQHGFPLSSQDLDEEDPGYKKAVAWRVRHLLHQAALQEKLVTLMLKPAADQFILSGLDDLLTLMADMTFDD